MGAPATTLGGRRKPQNGEYARQELDVTGHGRTRALPLSAPEFAEPSRLGRRLDPSPVWSTVWCLGWQLVPRASGPVTAPGSIVSRTGASAPAACPISCGEHGEGQQRTVLTQSPWVRAWEALWSLGRGGVWCPQSRFLLSFPNVWEAGLKFMPLHPPLPRPRALGSSSSQGWQ